VRVYLKTCYSVPDAVSAPRNDLHLIAQLVQFETVNSSAAKAALDKMEGHLCYLKEQALGLSIFDTNLSNHERKQIDNSLQDRAGCVENVKRRKSFDIRQLAQNSLSDLVTVNTEKFFQILGIPTDFSKEDVHMWEQHPSYQYGNKIANSPRVVSDHAERSIKLMQDFNRSLTKREEVFQDV